MLQFSCDKNGITYYDNVLGAECFIDNNMLFILGYSKALTKSMPTHKLVIPKYFSSEKVLIAYPEDEVRSKIKDYLFNYYKLNYFEYGYYVEINGLTNILEKIGLTEYYSNSYTNTENIKPHVPLFTRKSCDFNRIKTILNDSVYHKYDCKPIDGKDEKYDVINEREVKYIELYNSFGSSTYMNKVLYRLDDVKNNVDSYSSFYVWNSLSFNSLYHFSLGVLYGMVQLGYGILPFIYRPSNFFDENSENIHLYDEAHFWFQNAEVSDDSKNDIFDPLRTQFKYDTYPISGYRVGITNKVNYGSLWINTNCMWGCNLNTSFNSINGIYENEITSNLDGLVVQNISEYLSSFDVYDGNNIDDKIEKIIFLKDFKPFTEINNEVKFHITGVPKTVNGENNGLSVETEIPLMNEGTSVDKSSFITFPSENWDYGKVIKLPDNIYKLDYNGNIKWNTDHPLFTMLYGIEFEVTYDKTTYVSIYNIPDLNHENLILYSLIRDLYFFNNEWMNEQKLNNIGWYIAPIFVYNSESNKTYSATIDENDITYGNTKISILDFYTDTSRTLGIVRVFEDIKKIKNNEQIEYKCYYDSYSNLYSIVGYYNTWKTEFELISEGWEFI